MNRTQSEWEDPSETWQQYQQRSHRAIAIESPKQDLAIPTPGDCREAFADWVDRNNRALCYEYLYSDHEDCRKRNRDGITADECWQAPEPDEFSIANAALAESGLYNRLTSLHSNQQQELTREWQRLPYWMDGLNTELQLISERGDVFTEEQSIESAEQKSDRKRAFLAERRTEQLQKQLAESELKWASKISEQQQEISELSAKLKTFERANELNVRVDCTNQGKTHVVESKMHRALCEAWNRAGMPYVDPDAATTEQFDTLNRIREQDVSWILGSGFEYRLLEAREFLSRQSWFTFAHVFTKDMDNRVRGKKERRLTLLLGGYFRPKKRRCRLAKFGSDGELVCDENVAVCPFDQLPDYVINCSELMARRDVQRYKSGLDFDRPVSSSILPF